MPHNAIFWLKMRYFLLLGAKKKNSGFQGQKNRVEKNSLCMENSWFSIPILFCLTTLGYIQELFLGVYFDKYKRVNAISWTLTNLLPSLRTTAAQKLTKQPLYLSRAFLSPSEVTIFKVSTCSCAGCVLYKSLYRSDMNDALEVCSTSPTHIFTSGLVLYWALG